MIQTLKASIFAIFGYLLTFFLFGVLAVLIPYPYFSPALVLCAVFAIFAATLIFTSLSSRFLIALFLVILAGFITAYLPLGVPMSDDLASCQRLACSRLQSDLNYSYFLVRGLPFIWQGYASPSWPHQPFLVKAPYSDLNRYQGDWWQPVAYWPNLVLNILIITLPSMFYLLLRRFFSPPKH